jgi:signal transduction histidine kinase/CheY-like chemotaxis protein
MRYLTPLLIAIACLVHSNLLSQNNSVYSTEDLEHLKKQIKDSVYNYKYSDAIKDTYKLIEEAKKSNNDFYEFRGLIELGFIHHLINDTSKANLYTKQALDKAIQTKTDSLIAWAYNDIANIQPITKDNYKELIDYYNKAITIYNNTPNFSPPVAEYMNIGNAYLTLNQPKKAYPYLLKAKELSKIELRHELLYINLDILFGRYYNAVGNYNEAIVVLEKNSPLAEQKYLKQFSRINNHLAIAYENTNNLGKANYSLKKKNETDKALSIIEKDVLLAETNAKFEFKEIQNKIKVAKEEQNKSNNYIEKHRLLNIISIILSIVLLIGLAAIFGLAKNRKKYIDALSKKNQELTDAKDKAEHLSKLKAKFFSTVSHEIRTPLYGVIGLSSILLEDKTLNKVHKTDLKSLKFSADYLLALINDVLMLSKMENNGIKLEKIPYKLDTLLNSITNSFAFILEQNNNKLITNIDPKMPNALIGDSIRLSQILMNLIGNAVKFNENGTIWVSIELIELTQDGKYISRFTIKDDGIGIPLEKQKTIFDEFSQVQNKNYNYQGTGLGLPIVVKLLALHNSTIELKSEPNKGAAFSFILPLEANLAVKRAINSDNITSEKDDICFKGCKILIVDDNKINQKITRKILEKKQFQCDIANNGEEAIELSKTNNYQLILMDINMPVMDGYEATKAIRLFNDQTPIVALTAVEAEEVREKIMMVGMNDIILKPYDNSQFFTTILKNINLVVS